MACLPPATHTTFPALPAARMAARASAAERTETTRSTTVGFSCEWTSLTSVPIPSGFTELLRSGLAAVLIGRGSVVIAAVDAPKMDARRRPLYTCDDVEPSIAIPAKKPFTAEDAEERGGRGQPPPPMARLVGLMNRSLRHWHPVGGRSPFASECCRAGAHLGKHSAPLCGLCG